LIITIIFSTKHSINSIRFNFRKKKGKGEKMEGKERKGKERKRKEKEEKK
jgi:hypothetical protein